MDDLKPLLFLRVRRSVRVLIAVAATVAVFATCVDRGQKTAASDGVYGTYAGDAACASCHGDIAAAHGRTAHAHTSARADAASILGSFLPGENRFDYDDHHAVRMEKRDSGFYQVGYLDGQERLARRFDLTIGSGAKGQSFAYWLDRQLYQLPITYFSQARAWSNSPGYPLSPVVFNRPIFARCLECHATYADVVSPPDYEPQQFDSARLLLGVGCERCHGPAAQHVAFQQAHPEEKKAMYIVNTARLPRERQLDLCGFCHGGRLYPRKAAFSYTAGDSLGEFFAWDHRLPSPDSVDVHGNQLGLLRGSRCFEESDMTCASCHDVHANERGKTEVFSARCQTCHAEGKAHTCALAGKVAFSLKENCIDCHMPARESTLITLRLPGDKTNTSAMVRSHHIGIYPDATSRFEAGQKKGGAKSLPSPGQSFR